MGDFIFSKEACRLTHGQLYTIATQSKDSLHAVLMAQELVLGNVVIALTPQKDTDEILQRPDSRDDLSAPTC